MLKPFRELLALPPSSRVFSAQKETPKGCGNHWPFGSGPLQNVPALRTGSLGI